MCIRDRRYTIAEHGPKIDAFLKKLLPLLGVDVRYEMAENETVHPEFENPDIRVKFSGRNVDDLLANKTEMMLALEHLTLEILRVPAEEHSRICFDANDHRVLRIEEPVSYTHLRAHETPEHLVCRLLLEK